MTDWINEIIVWAGVGISGLAGTGIAIGSVAIWLKNIVVAVIGKLTESKTDYEAEVKKLNEAARKLDTASKAMDELSTRLKGFEDKLNAIGAVFADTNDKYQRIIEAVSIMATSDKQLVASGKAKQITELLGTTPQEIPAGEVKNG